MPTVTRERSSEVMPAETLPAKLRRRIVVIGCGFAGLNAALELGRRYVPRWADVTLVDANGYHVFTPLLYEAATGEIQASRLRYPVDELLRRRGMRLERAPALAIDPAARQVQLSTGVLSYDFLMVGAGSVTNYFGRDEFGANSFPLKSLENAAQIAAHLQKCVDRAPAAGSREREELLTFVVVGAGPTGVELAGSLQQALNERLWRGENRELGRSRVLLVEAARTVLSRLHPSVGAAAEASLKAEGVTVLCGSPVLEVCPHSIQLAGGLTVRTRTVIWTAGTKASQIPGLPGVRSSADGRVIVDSFLKLQEQPEVYVIGDMAAVTWANGYVPANAPAAVQMGRAAARNVTRTMLNLPPIAFRYQHKGDLLSLGRHAAVARIGSRTQTGSAAWLLRRAIYISNLMGGRNRMGLAADWLRSERSR